MRRLLDVDPTQTDARYQLSIVLRRAERLEEALDWLFPLAVERPLHAQTQHGLAITLARLGRHTEALTAFEAAISAPNAAPEFWSNYALSLAILGRGDDCKAAHQRAVALQPHDASLHVAMAASLSELACFDEALAALACALALDPQHAEARTRVVRTLNRKAGQAIDRGDTDAGLQTYRLLLAIDDQTPKFVSNYLFALQYDTKVPAKQARREHERLAGAYGLPSPLMRQATQKKLRIGYVSPNLSAHPVGAFLLPIFAHHQHDEFEFFVYSDRRDEDSVTRKLRKYPLNWHRSVDWSNDTLYQQIRADRVDLLIDLAGHTALHRLPVFAQRAAPVQVSWAGYVGTTGLPAMDWLLADRWHAPVGSESEFRERVWRLPNGYVAWQPPKYAPPVGDLPFNTHRRVTFGCLNKLAKATPAAIERWCAVLHAVPGSRMRVADPQLADDAFREHWAARFIGIERDRLLLSPGGTHPEFLGIYNDIDIALDPTPYSGGVTTLESLWMGVPVLTLPGDRFASRHATSHLSQAGLGELVAESESDLVHRAVALAQDPRKMQQYRTTLRQRLAEAPSCNGLQFTRDLEAAFRGMWSALD